MNGSDTSKVSKKDLIQAATLALAVSAFGGGNNYVIGEGFGEDSAAAECAILCLNMQDASECTSAGDAALCILGYAGPAMRG